MTSKRKLAVTGYRGVWGESLNEQIAFEYIRSFARFIKSKGGKKILIGKDTRASGEKILACAQEAFKKEGVEIVHAGVVPTPSILLLVRKLGLDGGVMITASHNPIQYNGIKFIVKGGRMINEGEVVEIENFRGTMSDAEKIPELSEKAEINIDNSNFRRMHIDEILKAVNVEKIKEKKFKVALDSINGTGVIITQELLKELGCEVHIINETQDGNFAHIPEPLPENLGQIATKVSEVKADIGFAQDPDADRLVVVDEKGTVINEEYTLVFVVKNILNKEKGTVVVNIQTSRMNEELAKEYGQPLLYSKVGEGNLIETMSRVNAIVGGEGGGGAIYPKINTARDSLVGIALILELLATENKKVSEIVESLPRYVSRKAKIPLLEDVATVYRKLKERFADAILDESDGVCFSWTDSAWISVRPSTTEPLIRIIGEAKTPERIESVLEQVKLTLNDK